MVSRRIGCFLVALCGLSFSPILYSASSYHLGNSLTWMMSPDGLSAMAGSSAIPLDVGYHVTFGKGLEYIRDNPEEITRTNRFGGFSAALKNNAWDHITLQPYGSGETLRSDIDHMVYFIDLVLSGPSCSPDFYIFETWPIDDASDYGEIWTRSIPDDPGVAAVHSRQY